ncbi:hypothetical protein QK412_10065 [Pseudomonas aeruginosa]|nr:hypothetical protein [Pseudomonas aeruginosa]
MPSKNFYDNYLQVLVAIEHCERQNLLLPALIMTYSAIDSVSWLAADSSKDSGKAFRKWVSEWMLKSRSLQCSADELYAARCGILHTFTPTSTLNAKGVRKIGYSWGTGDNSKLEQLIDATRSQETIVSIHLSDLIQTFRNAMADYLEYVYSDPQREAAFEAKTSEHFSTLGIETVDEYLELKATSPR